MINLSETYIYEGRKNWETGKRVTAQKKIKTGETVRITFLGASEEMININISDGRSILQFTNLRRRPVGTSGKQYRYL